MLPNVLNTLLGHESNRWELLGRLDGHFIAVKSRIALYTDTLMVLMDFNSMSTGRTLHWMNISIESVCWGWEWSCSQKVLLDLFSLFSLPDSRKISVISQSDRFGRIWCNGMRIRRLASLINSIIVSFIIYRTTDQHINCLRLLHKYVERKEVDIQFHYHIEGP